MSQDFSTHGVEWHGRPAKSGRFSAEPEFTAEIASDDICATLVDVVREEAERIPSVEAVYVRPDGLEFVMTGSDPSPAMYEACGEVASRVQQVVDASGAVYVEGGWRRNQAPIEGWIVAYSRRR